MAFDVRLIAEDRRIGRLYRVVGDEDGRLAFIEIEPHKVRKCDQRFLFNDSTALVGIVFGKEVLYPHGEHPTLSETDVSAP